MADRLDSLVEDLEALLWELRKEVQRKRRESSVSMPVGAEAKTCDNCALDGKKVENITLHKPEEWIQDDNGDWALRNRYCGGTPCRAKGCGFWQAISDAGRHADVFGFGGFCG